MENAASPAAVARSLPKCSAPPSELTRAHHHPARGPTSRPRAHHHPARGPTLSPPSSLGWGTSEKVCVYFPSTVRPLLSELIHSLRIPSELIHSLPSEIISGGTLQILKKRPRILCVHFPSELTPKADSLGSTRVQPCVQDRVNSSTGSVVRLATG